MIRSILIYMIIFSTTLNSAEPFVTARLWGRLGNILFIIAAAQSVAWDNDAEAVFPDLVKELDPNKPLDLNYALNNLKSSYKHILPHLNTTNNDAKIDTVYREKNFSYDPIPYQPNMVIEGWFQSEKYFVHHKEKIQDLYAPSETIMEYLKSKYQDIIESANTVSVHLRCYTKENQTLDLIYPTYGREYFLKALTLFDEDAEFIVFSDQTEWVKEQLADIPRNIRIIENEPYYHDFYLMSLCKHNIISNSTFSWWAAYLNLNPDKIVVVPGLWFTKEYNHCTQDLIPDGWIIIN